MDTLGTLTRDNLIAGDFPLVTDDITFGASLTLVRGTAVGKIKLGAVTAVADESNTGDGTVTALSVLPGGVQPMVGAYNLECTAEVANGGVWKLEDPNGALITAKLTMTAGAGVATIFEAGGLTFTITDGSEDFDTGDIYVVTVAAGSGYGVALDNTLTSGAQFIYGILAEDVTTGSGETQLATIYKTGQFNSRELVFGAGTAASYKDAAADKSIFFEDSVAE